MEWQPRCKDCKWIGDLRRPAACFERSIVGRKVNPGQFACKEFKIKDKVREAR